MSSLLNRPPVFRGERIIKLDQTRQFHLCFNLVLFCNEGLEAISKRNEEWIDGGFTELLNTTTEWWCHLVRFLSYWQLQITCSRNFWFLFLSPAAASRRILVTTRESVQDASKHFSGSFVTCSSILRFQYTKTRNTLEGHTHITVDF